MKEKLRILHIPAWYPSRQNPVSGVFVQEHIRALRPYDDSVVLYSEGVDLLINNVYRIDDQIENGIRVLRLHYRKSPIPKTSYAIYLWGIFAGFRKLLNEDWRPDVIHAHIYSAGVPSVFLGKRYSIPVVVTEQFTGFPRGTIRGVERLKAKFVFEQADMVCPVSADLAQHIERYGVQAKFRVIPNTVDLSLFFPGDRQAELNGDRKKKRILTVALLTPKKGIPYLIQALSEIKKDRKDFVLDIVGEGSSRADYEELARELDLTDMVHFHGLKTKQEVAVFMRQSDFFVLPSLFETFGAVLIEAMACGKPVVATDIGGPNEIVTPNVGKLVPPGDAAALAEAIGYMLDHYSEYDTESIVSYVMEKYGSDAIGKELDVVYRSVLKL